MIEPTKIMDISTIHEHTDIFTLPESDFQVAIYSSIQTVPNHWEVAAPPQNIFLQRAYLSVVEENPPIGMKSCYLLFYKNKQPIGVAICQIQNFKLDESLQDEESSPCFFTSVSNYFKKFISSRVDFTSLICGNLLLTGEHGFYFNPSKVNESQAFKIIEQALNSTVQYLRNKGTEISVCLLKEFHEPNRPHTAQLIDKRFNEFTIQPTMIMKVRPDWKSQEDYLAAMQSKYRVRAKRAFKKAKGIETRDFTERDILNNIDKLYELYQNIAIKAGFNVMSLDKQYMLGLKRAFPENFSLVGYYLGEELVGYHTTIHNGKEMEAHFLGFNQEVNRSHQLYLNMLYNIVKRGIELQVEEIVFARTALEIKSSVGAVAHEMYCYMRHRKSMTNRFFTTFMDYFEPKVEWTPRSPFKPVDTIS